jgi:hypothetical protein
MLVEDQRPIYITIRYKGDQFKLDGMDRVIITNGYDNGTNNMSVGISTKKTRGRPRNRWEDGIKRNNLDTWYEM